MRRFRLRLLAGLLPLALASAFASRLQAEPPQPPPYYAIENVRVVTGTGRTLDGATVLLAEGIIEDVGIGLKVPADAWLVDGTGLTLYPGLVDAMTSLGLKKEEEEGSSGRGGGFPGASQEAGAQGPQDRPMTTPWRSPAEELDEEADFGKWREAGFTTAVTAPENGIFAGQASLIGLGAQASVVATPVAQRLGLEGGGWREYPGSLMGVIAYIDQVFLDTAHYRLVKADYAKDPTGRVRPAYDRALEALETALAQGTPFVVPAHLGREIDRALALGDRFDLPVIVHGGQGAYARTEALARAKAAVVVSLNWPEEKKDRDPKATTPIRTLLHQRLAPSTPAALAEAGVPFAFTAGGLATPGEVFEGVRKAIEAGLNEEDALRALTVGAAAMFGADDRMGTIEQGKIANLVLASDWPWAEDVEVASVFVDGRRFYERESDEPTEAPAQDVSGTWTLTMQTPRGSREMTAELEMDDDGKVKGEIRSEMGDTRLEEGRMSADLLRFETTREWGGRSVTASWSLTVEGESLEGSMSAGPMAMDITGVRTEKPAAKAEVTSEDAAEAEGEEPEVTTEELQRAWSVVQGKVRAMDTFAITNARVWTISGPIIENGTVVVSDGKIRAVGTEVDIPRGAEVIDAQGGSLVPGIIDCHSHLGIEGGVNEGTLAVTSMVKIADVVNPDDIAIYRALAGGVTAANLLHGSSNPIGGQNQVIKLRWGGTAEELKLEGAPAGIKFALGENPKRSNFGGFGVPQRYPNTRMGVMDVIRQAFTDAIEYREHWQAYEKGPKRRGGVVLERPRRDMQMEALVEILEGERLVHSHCYRADEILQLMRLAEDFGFRVATLQHVLEGYKVADEIAAHGAGASTFSDWWGYKVEAFDAIPHAAALMAERGVVVSINSDSSEEIRHLNQEAGKAVKWGGAEEVEALAMVTLNPARQLGIEDRVGSIEVGKDADLALYDGHPLEIRSVVLKTFVDGDLYFDLEADRERQALIDDLAAKLGDREEEDSESEDAPPADESASEPAPEVRWADEFTYSCREAH